VEDLIQIAFFVVIIVASMMDGVRRQRQRQGRQEPPRQREMEGYGVEDPESASRYDDPESVSGPGRLDPPVEIDIDWDAGLPEGVLAEGPARTEDPLKADTMVPVDLWEEISAMARGEAPPLPIDPEPYPSGFPEARPAHKPAPVQAPDTSAWDEFESHGDGGGAWAPSKSIQARDAQRDHLSSRSIERDRAARGEARDERFAQEAGGKGGRSAGTDSAGVPKPVPHAPRKRLGLGGPDDLRRALLLKEVLGTPRGLAPPGVLPKDQDG
jgi:hypothetical protein